MRTLAHTPTKYMKIYIYSLFLIVICSCQHKSTHLALLDNDIANVDTIIKFPKLKGDEVFYYSDVYSEVRYVQLEETVNSMIGVISKIEITNSNDILVFDNMSGSIVLFDKNGKYKNHIGHRGNGANEYITPEDVVYDPYNNKVIVWDNKCNLMYFDMKGNMLKKLKLDWYIRTFNILDKNRLIVYMDYSEDLSKTNIGYNYKILSHEGKIDTEFDSYGEDMKDFHPSCKNTFCRYNERLFFQSPYTSKIMELCGKTAKFKYYLDFGEDKIPEAWLCGNNRDLNDKIRKYENKVFCTSYFISDNNIVMNLIRNRICYLAVYDKKEGTVITGILGINDIDALLSSSQVYSVKDNNVYCVIDPLNCEKYYSMIKDVSCPSNVSGGIAEKFSDEMNSILSLFNHNSLLEEYINAIKEKKTILTSKEKEFLKNASSFENPIIQICTLK